MTLWLNKLERLSLQPFFAKPNICDEGEKGFPSNGLARETVFTRLHFLCYLRMGPTQHHTRLKRLAADKHSSFLF
jgi:hypothetical protein